MKKIKKGVRGVYEAKEVIAAIGIFAIDEKGRELILGSSVAQSIVRSALENFQDGKIVKSSLGCLTNLAVV